jgi:hypothetical protein
MDTNGVRPSEGPTDEDQATADAMRRLAEGLFAAERSPAAQALPGLLQGLAQAQPELIERLSAAIQIRRAGLRAGATTH